MQWRMVGRRGRTATWTIVGDPAQSSWPVPGGVRRGPRRGARGQGAPRLPPLHELPQLRRDLRLRRGVRRARRSRRRPARRGPLDRVSRPSVAGRPDLEAAVRDALARLAGVVAGTVGIVVPVARRSRSRLAGVVAELAEDAAGTARRADAAAMPGRGAHRLDTKGLEFDGSWWSSRTRSRPSPPTGRATLYVVLTRATQRTRYRRPRVGALGPRSRFALVACGHDRGSRPSRRARALDRLVTQPAWAAIRLRDSATVTLVGGSLSTVERLADVPLEEGAPESGRRFDRLRRDPVPPGRRARLRGARRRHPAGRGRDRDRAGGPARRPARRRCPTAGRVRGPRRLRATDEDYAERRRAGSSATRSATARAPTSSSAGTTARQLARLGRRQGADRLPAAARARARRLLDLTASSPATGT